MNYTSSKGILGMLGEIVSRLGDASITTNLIEAFNRRGTKPRWISIRPTSTSLRAEVPWGFLVHGSNSER